MDLAVSMDVLILLIAAAVAAILGALLMHLRSQGNIARLREENTALKTRLEMEKHAADEKLALLEQAREQLAQTFGALSSEALKSNNEEFLKLAREKLQQFNIQARSDLTEKEKAIENLVKPIRELLDKTQQQIRLMEHERKESYGSITKHLETMAQTQQLLHGETRNLVKALRRPEVRGQWGELTLKRLVELAGMVEYCDFYEQEHTLTEDGAVRPDMIVRMPGGREIVIDVKTPLDAYLNAIEAPDDAARQLALEHHSRKMRERVQELASKAYWKQFKHSPDFVVLFIPGEHFLSAALDQNPGLLEEALGKKVILATPTSLVALLRAIAFGWNQQAVTENAEKIRDLGEDLYKRIATFTGHLAKLGSHLSSSVDHYNKAVGSFERQVLPGARKFTEMGIKAGKPVEPLEPLDKSVRQIAENKVEE